MSPRRYDRHPIWLNHRDFEIAILYLAHVPMEDIGDMAELSRERIRQIIRQSGVPFRHRQGRRPADPLRILRALPQATSWLELAELSNHTERSVRDCLRALGHYERAEEQFQSTRNLYQESELIEHLVILAQGLGRTPGIHDINAAEGPWHTTYVRYFGSIRAAQEAAGLTPNPRGGST